MRHVMLAGVVVLMAGTAFGQSQPVAKPSPDAPTSNQQSRENEGSRVLRASRLPKLAEEVREKGVPEGDMRQALKAAKNKGVRAGDMADMTKEHSRAIDEHGPTDNFGAFVQGKLDQGLRGQALSDAIRAEHAARGKGKGAIKNTGKGKDKDKVAKERDAKDREKNEKDREKEKREKDAREKAEKAEKESKDVKEKEPKGNGKGKGN